MECYWLRCCRPARQLPAVAEPAYRIKWPPRLRPGAPHTIVVIQRALRQCTTPTPYSGARPQRRLLQIRVQSPSIFKDAGKRPNARVTFGEQHLRVYGDVAVNTGYYTFSDVRDGKEVSRPARFTMVFRNRNGKWLIVAHHSSEVP